MKRAWSFLFVLTLSFSSGSSNQCDNLWPGSEYADGFCFLLIAERLTFFQAQEKCTGMGTFLAEPNTPSLKAFIRYLAYKHYDSETAVILGAVKALNMEEYRWVTSGEVCYVHDRDPENTGEFKIVVMFGKYGPEMQSAEAGTTGNFICQRVSMYNHAYSAAVPDSALAGHDSALLSASYASTTEAWVYTELLSYPGGQREIKSFIGQNGVNYELNNTKLESQGGEGRSFVVRSTHPLHLVLVLWRHDLTMLSSSLVLPVGEFPQPSSMLSQSTAEDVVGLGIISTCENETALTLAFFNGTADSGFRVSGSYFKPRLLLTLWPHEGMSIQKRSDRSTRPTQALIRHNSTARPQLSSLNHHIGVDSDALSCGVTRKQGRSALNFNTCFKEKGKGDFELTGKKTHRDAMSLTYQLSDEEIAVYLEEVTGFNKAQLIHSDGCLSAFRSSARSNAWISDVTFDQLLPTSMLGTEYVTFPSSRLATYGVDTFTIVAVFDSTIVTIYGADSTAESYEIVLEQVGDTYDLDLPTTGFHHMKSWKPFYVQARLGGSVYSGGSCTVTLLPETLWSTQYVLQVLEPYILLNEIYLIVIGQRYAVEQMAMTFTWVGTVNSLRPDCRDITASSYSACYLEVPPYQKTYTLYSPDMQPFAAYVFARQPHTMASMCHQLGIATTVTAGHTMTFDADAYLAQNIEEKFVPEPCTTMTTEQTTEYETTASFEETTQQETTVSFEETTMHETTTSFDETTTAFEETTKRETTSSFEETTQQETTASFDETTMHETTTAFEETTNREITTSFAETTQQETTTSFEETTRLETTNLSELTTGKPQPSTTEELDVICTPEETRIPLNITVEEVQEIAAVISQALVMEKASTSQARRKKESSPDNRVSSVSFGVLAIAFICFTVGFVIALDALALFTCPAPGHVSPAKEEISCT
ncbi:secreted protein [Plakobranchus ocellatus]|uniref:Secreted protein n=1 Tax=Plakobranchus ocellatus TaxID=259542 RepID=A0AAV4CEK7_9GAST|nr:secreted protein [Plakobranchus ocellatus]